MAERALMQEDEVRDRARDTLGLHGDDREALMGVGQITTLNSFAEHRV